MLSNLQEVGEFLPGEVLGCHLAASFKVTAMHDESLDFLLGGHLLVVQLFELQQPSQHSSAIESARDLVLHQRTTVERDMPEVAETD